MLHVVDPGKDSSGMSDFSASYTYGTTPGIAATGMWPNSPECTLSDTYVVCHRDEIGDL